MTKTDKFLFTPGPLTTSMSVKNAMAHDLGSRDKQFILCVKKIRRLLLKLAGLDNIPGYDAILMQGSGTFGIESVISSVIPHDGHLLVIENGAYGKRIVDMARIYNIKVSVASFPEDTAPSETVIKDILDKEKKITHVAVVHCETTTGIFNDIESLGKVVKENGKIYIIDAMSSFGAVPIDFEQSGIDFLVSSANKCIQGVPGFSFIIARIPLLNASRGIDRTLSLNLISQWDGLNMNGQFRFTPPVQAILAFHEALVELEIEGGVERRKQRYQKNYKTLMEGMTNMGFKAYLPTERQGYIITSFLYPDSKLFDFNRFYELLNEKGFVIYPGKLSKADIFRIGTLGDISINEINDLLSCIKEVKEEMGF